MDMSEEIVKESFEKIIIQQAHPLNNEENEEGENDMDIIDKENNDDIESVCEDFDEDSPDLQYDISIFKN